MASAMLAARLQGRRVEALSERTADSTTYVNADGTLTTEAFAGPVRVQLDDGVWRDVDTTLTDSGDDLQPVATVADVAFSNGGDRRLAAVEHGGRMFGMDWPTALPEPVVDGSTAAYALGGGATLNVTALPQGFEQTIVLDRAPASPPSYRIPMRLEGLELSKGAAGHLLLKDPKGTLVAEAAAPHLWDSSLNPASGESAHQGEVTTSIERAADGGTTLVLTPAPEFFAQDLTYPVTVDPTSTLAVTTDTWVQKPDYPDSQQGSQELKSGSYDGGSHVAESYLKFDVAKFKGTHVLKATMSLYSYYSSSCSTSGATTDASRITSSWDSAKITWGSRPSVTAVNSSTNTGRWGYNDSCPPNWSNWGMAKLVQDWADGATNYGLRVASSNEKDVTAWRRFRSANYTTSGYAPKLVVDYNSRPGTPTPLGPLDGAFTNAVKPTFSAKSVDPDGNTVQLTFEVWKSNGTSALASGTSPFVASGATASWAATTALAEGAYKWRARASDGTDSSDAWSAWQNFTVDTTRPGAPFVTSADYPADGVWHGGSRPGGPVLLHPGIRHHGPGRVRVLAGRGRSGDRGGHRRHHGVDHAFG